MAKGIYKEWLTPERLSLLEAWCRDGLIDADIAKRIGIRRETLYDWKNKYPLISNALKKGKEIIDIEVENSLLKRAMGYEYEEVTEERVGEMGLITTKIVKKQVVPDTTAQIFWLKNRKPKEWRDKQEIDIQGQISLETLIEKVKGEEY